MLCTASGQFQAVSHDLVVYSQHHWVRMLPLLLSLPSCPHFFCVLAFFVLLLIGSKLLSNSSVLCSVRGFASWMLDQPFTSHSLWFCPLPRRISCSQFLAVLVGFKLPFSGPRVRLHSSHTSLDPALFPHSSHSQGIFFPSSGCG